MDLMHWRIRRKFYYTIIALLPLMILAGALYYSFAFPDPTCSDGVQNGNEAGVDCGGVCEQICQSGITGARVNWSRSFLVSDDVYNAAAYIENPNSSLEAKSVPYRFRLYDRKDLLIAERRGTMLIPPQPVTVAFESGIEADGRPVARTDFSFVGEPFWEKSDRTRVRLPVANKTLLNGTSSKPRLTFDIQNKSIYDYREIDIAGVIYNGIKKPVHVSQTHFDRLEGQSSKPGVYTWRRQLPTKEVTCEVPSDIMLLLDRSGSMNEESASPPQPFTSVKNAASDFVDLLGTQTRLGLVTFATNANVNQRMSFNHADTSADINRIFIRPKDETGFTNIGAAVRLARKQLTAGNQDREKVMILLTDGKANKPDDPGGEAYARQQVSQAKQAGITVYTIGLGSQVNQAFMSSIASSPDKYLQVADRTVLTNVYERIHSDICQQAPSITEIIPTHYEIAD